MLQVFDFGTIHRISMETVSGIKFETEEIPISRSVVPWLDVTSSEDD